MKCAAGPRAFVALSLMLTPVAVAAQTVPSPEPTTPAPQIEVDGTGIATLEGHFPRLALPAGESAGTSRISLEDSALLLGAAQRLFRAGGIGSFVIGATTTEENDASNGTSLFLHQAFLDYQTRPMEAYVGRTDTPTRLIDFPTVRGDDLSEFVDVLDPFSNGDNPELHRYANAAGVAWNSKLTDFVDLHVQHLLNTAAGTGRASGINSYGVAFQHRGLPGLNAITRVPMWGLGYERQTVGTGSGGADNVAYAGLVYNVNPSPVNRVDVRLQAVYSFGNTLTAFSDVTDTFRAASNAVAASVRYLHSPFGKPGFQVALTGGYKTFAHVPGAGTFVVALTGVKRLGQGFDLVLQYTYQHRNPAYAAVFSGIRDEQAVEAGFVFSFSSIFNRHLGPRRSLLNLQHQYIPD